MDVMVAWDFHKLVPLGRGVGGEILPAQTPVASSLQVGQRRPLSSPCLVTVAWGLGGCHRNVGIQAMKLHYTGTAGAATVRATARSARDKALKGKLVRELAKRALPAPTL